MIRLAAALLLWPGLALSQQADKAVRVDVYVFELYEGQEWPVLSDVRVMGTDLEKRTERDGRTFFDLAACDQTVVIEAQPVMSFMGKATARCDGIPVPIKISQLYAGTTIRALMAPTGIEAGLADDPQLANLLRETGNIDRFAQLRGAYEEGDLTLAARLATDLSWTLRDAAPGKAQAFSVIAMDAGYRAIGFDPADQTAPLINFDPDQNLYVMSNFGEAVIGDFSTIAEVEDATPWSAPVLNTLQGLSAMERDMIFQQIQMR